jgi:murein L,D-transpeptidase YcbB/YkuD
MKTRYWAAAAVMFLAIGAALPTLSWAQDASPDSEPFAVREHEFAIKQAAEAHKHAEKAIRKAAANVQRVEEVQFQKIFAGRPDRPRHLTQIQDVADKFSAAEEESQKAAALKQLNELVDQFFEQDMEVRKQELADIEARLAKLRAQLDRRRAKKQEIVELEVKVAINRAEGLGFTSEPRENQMFNIRVPMPAMIPPDAPKFDALSTRTISSDLPPAPTRIEVAVPSPPAPPFGAELVLGAGAKGDAVRQVQAALNEQLDPSPELAVDGDFGPETEKALKAFQAKHDLKETGIADEATLKKLDISSNLGPFIKD